MDLGLAIYGSCWGGLGPRHIEELRLMPRSWFFGPDQKQWSASSPTLILIWTMFGHTNSFLFSEYAIYLFISMPLTLLSQIPPPPSQSDEILILIWEAAHMLSLRNICPNHPKLQSLCPQGSHHILFMSMSGHLFVQSIYNEHLPRIWGPEMNQSSSCGLSESSWGDSQVKKDNHNSRAVINPSVKVNRGFCGSQRERTQPRLGKHRKSSRGRIVFKDE